MVEIIVSMGKLVELPPKTAISLPELVQQTNHFSIKNRPGCNPALVESLPKKLYLHYKVTCHLPSSDPRGHEVQVRFDLAKIRDSKNAKDMDVKVSCTCPAFLYWGEQWNLHQRDALEGPPRPLLQPPTERLDLRSHAIICKHCKAVFERILPAIQHNINNILREIEVKQKKKTLPPSSDRLVKEQEKMRRRKEEEKAKKEKQQLDQLQKEEEEKLLQEEGLEPEKEVVQRTEPSTPALKEEKQPDKQPVEKELLDQLAEEEEKKLEEEKKNNEEGE